MKNLKKTILILTCLLLVGITTFSEMQLEMEDDFESYNTSSPIVLTTSSPSGWTRVNSLDSAFTAEIKNVDSNNLLSMKINTGSVNTHQKVRKEINSIGISQNMTYNFRVKVPSGISNGSGGYFNDYSISGNTTANLLVNLDDTNGTEIASFYFAPNKDNIVVRYCGNKNDIEDVDLPGELSSPFKYDEWIYVSVKVYTAEKKFTYTVTNKDDTTCLITYEDAIWLRNLKKSGFSGIPKYATAYFFRMCKNFIAYVDDFEIYSEPDPDIELVKADKAVLTTGLLDENNIEENFHLPITGSVNNSTISWSSNSSAISVDSLGYAQISQTDTRQTVTLTATIKKGYYYETKDFILKVAPVSLEIKALSVLPPVYTKGDAPVAAPETGFINTEITVKNLDTTNLSNLLLAVVVFDKTTGQIMDIITATKSVGTNKQITLKAGVDFNSATQTYQYFIWDNNRVPLINSTPKKVENLTASAKAKNISLSWDKSHDDNAAIKEYIIKRNNTVIDTVQTLAYSDTNIDDILEYTYQIIAVDHEGLESDAAEISTAAERMFTAVLQGETQEEVDANCYFLKMVVNNNRIGGDSYTEPAEKGGVLCRKTANRSDISLSTTYLYLSVDGTKILKSDNNITLEITYFDEGINGITLQYNAIPDPGSDPETNNIAKSISIETRQNTMTWKTVVISLEDANFRKPQKLTYSDFRIQGAGNSELYVSKVAAIQTEKY